jgi:hypothetical protein
MVLILRPKISNIQFYDTYECSDDLCQIQKNMRFLENEITIREWTEKRTSHTPIHMDKVFGYTVHQLEYGCGDLSILFECKRNDKLVDHPMPTYIFRRTMSFLMQI